MIKKKWIQIRIWTKALPPIMVFDGVATCNTNSMPPKEYTLNIPQRVDEVPIDILYLEGETSPNSQKLQERVILSKEKGIISTISSFFNGNRINRVKIEIFFNENEDGLCIGFLALRFIPLKYIVKNEFRGNYAEREVVISSGSTGKPAKEVFLENYSVFGHLLPLTSAHADNAIADKWECVIKSIEHSDQLLLEFDKFKSNLDAWLNLLCSWGLKQDGCKQYPGLLLNLERYSIYDSSPIDQEVDYTVIVPCWTIWVDNNGRLIETTILKGVVTAKSNGKDS